MQTEPLLCSGLLRLGRYWLRIHVGQGNIALFILQRPYNGKSRKDIRDAIFAKQIQIKKHEIPEGWSIEAADFINKVCSLRI